jgi:hypothetical protein
MLTLKRIEGVSVEVGKIQTLINFQYNTLVGITCLMLCNYPTISYTNRTF